ncbi:MAG: Fic family protein [Planctomycetes bacterium]|nr:Fic family protein [Planctomycetota bacterium]
MGKEKAPFEAPDATRVEAEMSRFFVWFNGPRSTDPILKAGVAHFRFVTIHPFADGNGRIARAIADLALARADETKDRFDSMSFQIEAEREDHYRELEAAQKGSLDFTRWRKWFLGGLEQTIDAAEQALDRRRTLLARGQRTTSQPVRRVVIHRLRNGVERLFTSSKEATIAKCSPDSPCVTTRISWSAESCCANAAAAEARATGSPRSTTGDGAEPRVKSSTCGASASRIVRPLGRPGPPAGRRTGVRTGGEFAQDQRGRQVGSSSGISACAATRPGSGRVASAAPVVASLERTQEPGASSIIGFRSMRYVAGTDFARDSSASWRTSSLSVHACASISASFRATSSSETARSKSAR